MKNCEICGLGFDSKGTTKKFCGREHSKECLGCGTTFVIKNLYRYKSTRSCSTSCRAKISHSKESQEKRVVNSREKHGTDRPQQSEEVKVRTIRANLEKYGVEYPMANEELRQKSYQTNIERYGVPHPLQNEEIKAKAADTLEARHGVRHPSQSPKLYNLAQRKIEEIYGATSYWGSERGKAELKAIYLAKYGFEYPSQVPAIKEKIAEGLAKYANENPGNKQISKINLSMASSIEEKFGVRVEYEKAIQGARFDLYIESHNLLIDINPTVTHNSVIAFACLLNSCEPECIKHIALARDYHFNRARIAKESGYKLIQLYSWDSERNINRLLSGRLAHISHKVSARKLACKKIPQKDANRFLELNHIQGSAKKQTHCYGLHGDNGELLAVATFGSSRFGNKMEYEFVRYAVKSDVIIHGGASVLWKRFKEEADPKSVVSYIDFDHTTSQSIFLDGLGFLEKEPTGPAVVWSKKDKRILDNSLRSIGADRLLGTSYGSRAECGLDNEQIMLREGWLKVYTAGNRIFVWNKE